MNFWDYFSYVLAYGICPLIGLAILWRTWPAYSKHVQEQVELHMMMAEARMEKFRAKLTAKQKERDEQSK